MTAFLVDLSPGYYCPTGTASYGVSNTCPAGYACPTGTANATSIPCSAGYYCPAGTVSNTTNPCPIGSYALAGAASCTLCPAGQYGAATALTTSTCSGPCAAGAICAAGSTSPSPANWCGDGVHIHGGCVLPCTADVGDIAFSSDPHPRLGLFLFAISTAGFYCPPNSTSLLPCPAGSTCPQGSTAPSVCPAGRYAPANSTAAACTLCVRGLPFSCERFGCNPQMRVRPCSLTPSYANDVGPCVVAPARGNVRVSVVADHVSMLRRMCEWLLLCRGVDDAERDSLSRRKLLPERDDRHEHAAMSSGLRVSRWNRWQRDVFTVRSRKLQRGWFGGLSTVSRWHDRPERWPVVLHDAVSCRCVLTRRSIRKSRCGIAGSCVWLCGYVVALMVRHVCLGCV